MMKGYFLNLAEKALRKNMENIIENLDEMPESTLLDCGCGNGSKTIAYAKKVKTKKVYGSDSNGKAIKAALRKGIKCSRQDLNKRTKYSNKKFDIIIANQLIEHLYDFDTFLSEMRRILKDDGFIVISTENLSSWQNIFSLLLGWQPTSISSATYKRKSIGNPFSMVKSKKVGNIHYRVFSIRGWEDFFEAHGFRIEKVLGSGYYPFPVFMANIMNKVDKRHSSLLTFKLRKK
jgi:ubiquinone/menaquinone biosynthesis C-methylase UbiE